MVLRKMDKVEDRRFRVVDCERKQRRLDVTETIAYKELYANNLRMYSFLLKKELDRRSQQKLLDKKEDYFQRHVSSQTSQRNNRLLKSFKQMSRMRTCVSDLDLSKIPDTDSPLKQQDRKQSLLDIRQPEEKVYARPRSRTVFDNSYTSMQAQYDFNKDFGESRKTAPNFLKVPSGIPVSPLASPTSSADKSMVSSFSPPSPSRQRYLTLNRRHYSDLGAWKTTDSDHNSDSDVTNSDSEFHSADNNNENELRDRSPSLNRARQAQIRHEFRKARLASLEGTITKANSILKDMRRTSWPKKTPETIITTEADVNDATKYGSLPKNF